MSVALELEVALRDLLLSCPGVSALVGDRVCALEVPQDEKLPALVYRFVESNEGSVQGGGDGLVRSRVEVSTIAHTYLVGRKVSRALNEALSHFRGSVPGHAVKFQGIFPAISSDELQPESNRVEIRNEFTVWTERTV